MPDEGTRAEGPRARPEGGLKEMVGQNGPANSMTDDSSPGQHRTNLQAAAGKSG